MMQDPYNLKRFVDAQAGIIDVALTEIQRGAKRSHWMWFVFPQLAGLGTSEMAQRYAIGSLAEATAYLEHPILRSRYLKAVSTLQDVTGRTAEGIFGPVDALKLRSSLTLFSQLGGTPILQAALDRWFAGVPDPATLLLLDAVPPIE